MPAISRRSAEYLLREPPRCAAGSCWRSPVLAPGRRQYAHLRTRPRLTGFRLLVCATQGPGRRPGSRSSWLERIAPSGRRFWLTAVGCVAQPSEQAETYAIRALAIAQRLRRTDLEAQALCYLRDARLARGDPLVEAELRRAITLAGSDSRVETRVRCYVNAGGQSVVESSTGQRRREVWVASALSRIAGGRAVRGSLEGDRVHQDSRVGEQADRIVLEDDGIPVAECGAGAGAALCDCGSASRRSKPANGPPSC
jgi:hypothetical protein